MSRRCYPLTYPLLTQSFAVRVGRVEPADATLPGRIHRCEGGVLVVPATEQVGAAWLLYAPLLMMRQGQYNGQTWGKQLLGIRVVRDNGEPFSFGPAALREVVLKGLAVGIASSIIPFIPWFLNFFWPLWDDENRALHDMAASTHVIRA